MIRLYVHAAQRSARSARLGRLPHAPPLAWLLSRAPSLPCPLTARCLTPSPPPAPARRHAGASPAPTCCQPAPTATPTHPTRAWWPASHAPPAPYHTPQASGARQVAPPHPTTTTTTTSQAQCSRRQRPPHPALPCGSIRAAEKRVEQPVVPDGRRRAALLQVPRGRSTQNRASPARTGTTVMPTPSGERGERPGPARRSASGQRPSGTPRLPLGCRAALPAAAARCCRDAFCLRPLGGAWHLPWQGNPGPAWLCPLAAPLGCPQGPWQRGLANAHRHGHSHPSPPAPLPSPAAPPASSVALAPRLGPPTSRSARCARLATT